MALYKVSRRDFIKTGIVSVGIAGVVPQFLFRSKPVLAGEIDNDQILVIIQLSGGNDGLNTVIPYTNDEYFKHRSTLKINNNEMIKVNDEIAFNNRMKNLKSLYDGGKLSLIQGVGYPNPNRSHFRSLEIWHTASDADDYLNEGWLGRYFKEMKDDDVDAKIGITIEKQLNPAFRNQEGIGVAFDVASGAGSRRQSRMRTNKDYDMQGHKGMKKVKPTNNLDFLRMTQTTAKESTAAITEASRNYNPKVEYPNTAIGRRMRLVAACIAAEFPTKVFYTALGGFDTHANQKQQHLNLLNLYDEAASAFQKDIEAQGFGDRVLTMTFSEFGRRVAENGSRGTDHGTAAPMFIMGKKIKPGIIGTHPSLTDLDNGDLKFHTDFRSVYATLLDNWMHVDAKSILGKSFSHLKIL